MSLGPAALTASLPRALGREPADELVLVGVSGLSLSAAVILTLPLSAVETAEEELDEALVIGVGVDQLRRDGATAAAVLVYAEDTTADSTAARYAATAVACVEAADLRVLDAIAVTDGRWRSYDCTNPFCCPPEGTPITGGPTP